MARLVLSLESIVLQRDGKRCDSLRHQLLIVATTVGCATSAVNSLTSLVTEQWHALQQTSRNRDRISNANGTPWTFATPEALGRSHPCSRIHQVNAPQNIAWLRKLALILLKRTPLDAAASCSAERLRTATVTISSPSSRRA